MCNFDFVELLHFIQAAKPESFSFGNAKEKQAFLLYFAHIIVTLQENRNQIIGGNGNEKDIYKTFDGHGDVAAPGVADALEHYYDIE